MRLPNPRHPSRSKRHRPRATSSHPHNAQSQPATVCAVEFVTGPHSARPAPEEPRAACPSHLPPGRTIWGGRVPNPGHPSTPPWNGKGDARTGPPPPFPPRTGRAKDPGRKRRRARTAWNGPTSVLRGDLAKGARQKATGGGETRLPQVREHTNTTDTRRAPKGQPDGARGTHRQHGMAYQQGRTRDTRAGQPARSSARDARERESERGGGATRSGTGPALLTCRQGRAHSNRALQPPRQ